MDRCCSSKLRAQKGRGLSRVLLVNAPHRKVCTISFIHSVWRLTTSTNSSFGLVSILLAFTPSPDTLHCRGRPRYHIFRTCRPRELVVPGHATRASECDAFEAAQPGVEFELVATICQPPKWRDQEARSLADLGSSPTPCSTRP
jgi:hypothetical protein